VDTCPSAQKRIILALFLLGVERVAESFPERLPGMLVLGKVLVL